MKKALIFMAIVALLSSCTIPDPKMNRIMKQEAITEYRLTGYEVFSCGKDEAFNSGFVGKKNGQPVSGVVCAAWKKSYTVRYH